MIPIANHVYSCTWRPGEATYINLITEVDSGYIYGKCIYSDKPGYNINASWTLRNWNEDAPRAVIIDLGHIDNLPELLI